MPICTQCHAGYEVTDRVCPSCGASPAVSLDRCGRIGMYSLWIAWAAALVGALVALVAGVVAVVRGEWLTGALLIFIGAPVSYGHHVALGMAISYAQRK